MQKKYKVLLLTILPLIVLMLFLNSNLFLNFLAETRRNMSVEKYRKMSKPYISEGVYKTYDDVYKSYSKINDFGIKDYVREFSHSREVLVYFSSNKFIIDYPYEVIVKQDYNLDNIKDYQSPKKYSNVQEEIVLSSDWTYCMSDASIDKGKVRSILWETEIIGWRLIDKKTKKELVDFKAELQKPVQNSNTSKKKLTLLIDTEKKEDHSSIYFSSKTLNSYNIILSDFVDKNKTLVANPEYLQYSKPCSYINDVKSYKHSSIFEVIRYLF